MLARRLFLLGSVAWPSIAKAQGTTGTGVLSVFPSRAPILDQISVSTFGYGLRLLRSGYSGNAIKVRRSSDNTTKDIGFTPLGALDTGALSTFVGGGSGFIDTWYDQVGSMNVTQATTANQPRIVNAGVIDKTANGSIGIFFGVGGSGLAISLFAASSAYTLAEVYSITASNEPSPPTVNYECVVTSNSGGDGDGSCEDLFAPGHWYPSGTNAWNAQTNVTQPPVTYLTDISNGAINQNWHKPVSNTGFYHGLTVGNSRAGMANPIDNASNWNGWICEVIGFGTALSLNNRNTLYGDQSNHFSITTNLLFQQVGVAPMMAYSTRLLTSNYIGKCMKVRRDSDNTTQDIGFLANGNLDVASLTAFVGANSGYIDTWYDQSSAGLNATQSTADAAHQPRIVNAGTLETINGHPVIRFGLSSTVVLNTASFGASNLIGEAFILTAMPGTAFDATNNPVIFSLNSGSQIFWIGDHNSSNFDGQSSNVGVNGATPTATITGAVFGGALQVVNFSRAGNNIGQGNLATGGQIGNQPSVGGFTNWNGWFGEFIIYPESFLNYTSVRPLIYQNQKAYWGTP